MSIRVHLALLLSAVVGATILLAGALTGRVVLQPFAREVIDAYIDQVVFVAGEIEKGAPAQELGERLNLEIRTSAEPPRFVQSWRRAGHRCQEQERRGRKVVVCRGPRAPVAVETASGWVVVRRDLDVGRPAERIVPLLLVVALAVILASAWIAMIVTRPLRESVSAMERMAKGDLSHRLPATNIREAKEVAGAFNRMADRVDTILRTERELMAGISHELRTPLARLRLETELLRDHGVPDARLSAMEGDLEEMDRLIGELLAHSRLSLGEQRLLIEDVDLRSIAEEVLANQPLRAHRVALEGGPAPVRGDRVQLARLFRNLFENAEKYAPEGSEVLVGFSGRRVEVSDRGPGAPPEDLPRLFEPFYRSPRTEARSTGHGLGLMIAKQVVEIHGGAIAAENRPGGGLTIRFEIGDPPAAGLSSP